MRRSQNNHAAQLVFSTLKDGKIVDATYVYSLAIDYKNFQARIYKLTIDFSKNTTLLEEMGTSDLPKVINITLSTLMSHANNRQ